LKIKVDISGVKSSKWYEFALRFLFGGGVTAFAGLAAKRFGPEVGGLFLAFPAILPATATLIKKREEQKKERAGYEGTERGRAAAAVDVAGSAMGGFGLVVFALIVWRNIRDWRTVVVLVVATAAWFLVALAVWELREKVGRQARAHRPNVPTHTLREQVSREGLVNRSLRINRGRKLD
jgi:hypothetical protein